jgi:RNA polymerase sigma factor (TIGR02999 family)
LNGGSERQSDESAIQVLADELVPVFLDELRGIAHRERRRLGGAASIETTALVNEAYLRLRKARTFVDDRHFFCAAAQAMRHALINHAQARCAAKRGAGVAALPLAEADRAGLESDERLIAIGAALQALAREAPRLARVVECRYYAGYSEAQTAQALGVSERTVRRDWTLAKAWLYRELGP